MLCCGYPAVDGAETLRCVHSDEECFSSSSVWRRFGIHPLVRARIRLFSSSRRPARFQFNENTGVLYTKKADFAACLLGWIVDKPLPLCRGWSLCPVFTLRSCCARCAMNWFHGLKISRPVLLPPQPLIISSQWFRRLMANVWGMKNVTARGDLQFSLILNMWDFLRLGLRLALG